MDRVRFGLRSQIVVALMGVLGLAATLTLVAVRPLVRVPARVARTQLGLTLSRAVAGQVALTYDVGAVRSLLVASVGEGGLKAASLYRPDGGLVASAGALTQRELTRPPYLDEVMVRGNVLAVRVLLPGRGVFVAESTLAPSAAERAVPGLVLLYAATASAAALFVVYVLLTRWIVRPIEGLTGAVERVAAGRRDVVAEARGAAEVERAALAFNRMTEQLRARETELSRRVAELERATGELHHAQEQVVRGARLAMVGRLAAGIAHEIGNPLAAIVGLTEVLKEGGLEPEESREFTERIGHEAQRIHRTVRELLDYARAVPEDSPGKDRGDPVEAISMVVRLLRPQKALRDVKLEAITAEDVEAVAVSTDRLVQVVLNLALNAADAVATEGGHELSLRVGMDGATVVLSVEDDGPGIPEELRRRVFEPFFTTKPAGKGTGLGLATSAAIVEQAGGTITAEPREDGGRGARLVVRLPGRGARLSRESLVSAGT